jgi:glycosyltransferase involved in cell wall biosynthesis
MSDLRIVQVVPNLEPGGTQRLVIELVRRTRRSRTCLVVCLDEKGDWALEVERHGVPVVALNRRPGFRPALGWQIARLARQHSTDVLHCHHYSAFVYGWMAATLIGAGVVFTEHGRLSDGPPSRKRRIINPFLGRAGGMIFAVSGKLREHMIAEGLPASRIGIIHNGIDPGAMGSPEAREAARRALGLPGDVVVIGTAARFDAVKDIGTLLRAVRHLQDAHPTSRLVLFGDGPERLALTLTCSELGLDPVVTFAGYRSDVRQLLPALDIFVNCSTSEGISLTILEAMAAGLPVVGTEVGGNPEIIVAGVTGLLVPTRNPKQLAAALAELSTDRERRAALGAAGRQRLLSAFAIERMIVDYEAQYARASRRTS